MPTPSARSRTPIVALLAALTLAAWAWTIHLGRAMPGMEMPAMDMTGMDMPGMDMPGMDMSGGATTTATDWSAAGYGGLFVMWAVMMVAMMTPAAGPAVLATARASEARPLRAAALFVVGYLALWSGFSAAAAGLQLALNHAGWLTPMGASARPGLSLGLLLLAGGYQFTAAKGRCLGACRVRGEGRATGQGLPDGLAYGLRCLGCCAALMPLLFVMGVMTLWWVALLAAVVFLERVSPWGRTVERTIGVACLAGAAVVAARMA